MSRSLSVWTRKAIRWLKPQSETVTVQVPDREAGPGRRQVIPRVVFQTAESRAVHPTHAKSIEKFRDLNPDLGFVLFDSSERDSYMLSQWGEHPIYPVYQRAILGQMRADIFRYCIVFERGGYYFDFNKGCERSLTTLHPREAEGLISYEKNPELIFPHVAVAKKLGNPFNLVLQWGFGFKKRHPFLGKVIDRIVEIEPFFRDQVFLRPKEALLTMSAPGVFTGVFREYVGQHGIGEITEAGVDFHGKGIFRLRGSKLLLKNENYYGKLSSAKIISEQ